MLLSRSGYHYVIRLFIKELGSSLSGSFDWKSLQKYLNPQSAEDFSRFLDTIPVHAGKGALIAAGIAWGFAAALGLFTMMQARDLTDLRAQLQTSEALKPIVPKISMIEPSKEETKTLAEQFKQVYPTLTVNANGGNFTIQSKKTADFISFREALGHAANGGTTWRVGLQNFCVGRECKQNALNAVLKIQKVKIDKPVS